MFNLSVAIVLPTPWWGIQKHGTVPIVFTEGSTESINLTQEALHASGSNTNIYPSMHTHVHREKHTCMHAYMNTLQVLSCLTYKWGTYSFTPQYALIRIFPARWIYLLNLSLSLCGPQQLLWHMMPRSVVEKNEQSLIIPGHKTFSLWNGCSQHRCCGNIADNQFLKVRNSWQQCWNYVTLMMDCSLFYSVTSMHLAQRYLPTNSISSELQIQIFISSIEGQTVYSHASCSMRLIWAKWCPEVKC